MKYQLIIAAAAVLSVAAGCSQAPEDVLSRYQLQGKVSSLEIISEAGEFSRKVVFRRDGRVRSIDYRNADGTHRYTESFAYDKTGKLLQISSVTADGVTDAIYKYEYDGEFVSECRVYGMNNDEVSRWSHRNDGEHIISTSYYSEGDEQYVVRKSYDGVTRHEESFLVDSDQPFGIADIVDLTADKPLSIKTSTIDISVEYNEYGWPVHATNTLLTSMCEIRWNPSLEAKPERWFKYETDSHGNWVRRSEHFHPDSSAVDVIVRKIEY